MALFRCVGVRRPAVGMDSGNENGMKRNCSENGMRTSGGQKFLEFRDLQIMISKGKNSLGAAGVGRKFWVLRLQNHESGTTRVFETPDLRKTGKKYGSEGLIFSKLSTGG